MSRKGAPRTCDVWANRTHWCSHCGQYGAHGAMREYVTDVWLHFSCFLPWFEQIYGRTCQRCKRHFYTQVKNARQNDSEFCFVCLPANTETTRLAMLVYQHNLRALRGGRPATLTIAQWRQTLADFGGRCAYCQTQSWRDIEHFIPLHIGGGTTATNCVPACLLCNARKYRTHPNDLDDARWQGRIGQIRTYLATR